MTRKTLARLAAPFLFSFALIAGTLTCPSPSRATAAPQAEFQFREVEAHSPQRLFRANLSSGQRLTLSTRGHSASLTAALLRHLNWEVPQPQHVQSLILRFDSLESRDLALEALAHQTQAPAGRWITELPATEPWVRLQDAWLEPEQKPSTPESPDPTAWAWATPGPEHVQWLSENPERRSVLLLWVLGDLPERINLYSTRPGRRDADKVQLPHPAAFAAAGVTQADLQLLANSLATIGRKGAEALVAEAHLPQELQPLVLERFLARLKHLCSLWDVPAKAIHPAPRLEWDGPGIKKGRATQSIYPGYASRFVDEDSRNPLNRAEIKRFLEIEGVNLGLNLLAQVVNQSLKLPDIGQLTRRKVSEAQARCATLGPSGAPLCTQPAGSWSGIAGGLKLQADRSIVTGTYYGGAPDQVQLVDRLTMSVEVGHYQSRHGLPQVGPVHERIGKTPIEGGNYLSLALSRDYAHVKPAGSLVKASDADWAVVAAPVLVNHLAKTLEPETLEQGLDPVSQGLLGKLKVGESLLITDSISLGDRIQARVPLANLLNLAILGFGPGMNVNFGAQGAILKRTTLTRTPRGFEVARQDIQQGGLEWSANASFLLEFMRLSQINRQAQGRTRLYQLDESPQVKRRLGSSLASLLRSHDTHLLDDSFPSRELHHELSTRINRSMFFAWNWFGLEESHLLTLQPERTATSGTAARQLFSHRILKTRGGNTTTFLNDTLERAPRQSRPLPQIGENPAHYPEASARWATWSAEAEITPTRESGPIAIAEHHWGGWGMTREQLLRTLEEIERTVRPLKLDAPVFRRDDFEGLERILFFDIQSRLQLSPLGVRELLKHLELVPEASTETTWQALVRLEKNAEDFKKWCTHQDLLASHQEEETPRHLFTEARPFPEVEARFCVRPWMKEVLSLRHRLFGSQKARTQATARLIRTLETSLPLPELLQPLERTEWRFQVKVMGFRVQKQTTQDALSSPWYSDLLGAEQDLTRTGIFGELRSSEGLSTFEVQGRYLTDIQ